MLTLFIYLIFIYGFTNSLSYKSHSRGIFHGDIKLENVMVTSWNWVYLIDFAPFKVQKQFFFFKFSF